MEPFTINGTTYLPVRAVANALGINVDWDGSSNTVILSNQKSENVAMGFNASVVASEVSVIKEYRWETNYGNKAAEFIEYIVLFKNNGKVVDYDWGYCVDDNFEIKPGMTEIEECSVSYRKEFNSVEIYLTGRIDR